MCDTCHPSPEFLKIHEKIHGPAWKQRQERDGMNVTAIHCGDCMGPMEKILVAFVFDQTEKYHCPNCASSRIFLEMTPMRRGDGS